MPVLIWPRPATVRGFFMRVALAAALRRIVRFRHHRSPAMTAGMRDLNPLLTFALCLTLVATSVVQAMARGQMAGGQMVQLCAGGEAVTVLVDAAGNTLSPSHPCPDCLAVNAALPLAAKGVGRPTLRWIRLAPPGTARRVAGLQRCACARGPPVLI